MVPVKLYPRSFPRPSLSTLAALPLNERGNPLTTTQVCSSLPTLTASGLRSYSVRKALKDMITSSAKFHLPIRSRGMSSMTEPHEERMEKRPRITLYRPPPRTATVDTADLEGRYACVRDTMRKVSIVDNCDVCSPSRFQVAGADAKTMAVASERVGGDVGCPWAAQLRCSICRRKCCSGGRNPRLAWDRNGVPLTALLFVLSM
jgi:hypothetical protein